MSSKSGDTRATIELVGGEWDGKVLEWPDGKGSTLPPFIEVQVTKPPSAAPRPRYLACYKPKTLSYRRARRRDDGTFVYVLRNLEL